MLKSAEVRGMAPCFFSRSREGPCFGEVDDILHQLVCGFATICEVSSISAGAGIALSTHRNCRYLHLEHQQKHVDFFSNPSVRDLWIPGCGTQLVHQTCCAPMGMGILLKKPPVNSALMIQLILSLFQNSNDAAQFLSQIPITR